MLVIVDSRVAELNYHNKGLDTCRQITKLDNLTINNYITVLRYSTFPTVSSRMLTFCFSVKNVLFPSKCQQRSGKRKMKCRDRLTFSTLTLAINHCHELIICRLYLKRKIHRERESKQKESE